MLRAGPDRASQPRHRRSIECRSRLRVGLSSREAVGSGSPALEAAEAILEKSTVRAQGRGHAHETASAPSGRGGGAHGEEAPTGGRKDQVVHASTRPPRGPRLRGDVRGDGGRRSGGDTQDQVLPSRWRKVLLADGHPVGQGRDRPHSRAKTGYGATNRRIRGRVLGRGLSGTVCLRTGGHSLEGCREQAAV